MSKRPLRFASMLLCCAFTIGCGAAAPEPCARLREALAACPQADDEDLNLACAQDPEAAAVADELAASACAKADGKADATIAAAFLPVCTGGLLTGSVVMRFRNAAGEPLSNAWKAALRPHYGDLVDQVKVHWGALMLDSVPGIYTSNTAAQTFGTHVYVTQRCTGDRSVFAYVAHELAHAKQVRALHGLVGFAALYCADFAAANFDYSDNALEKQARAEAEQVMRALPVAASLACR